MKKVRNKKRLLTLVTAVAMIATAAFSFAAWDQLSDDTGEVTTVVQDPVVVDTGELSEISNEYQRLGDDVVYTSDATVKTTGLAKVENLQMVLKPTVKYGDGNTEIGEMATVKVLKNGSGLPETGGEFKDIAPYETTAAAETGTAYEIQVTLKDGNQDTLKGQALKISMTAELSEVTN